MKMGFHSRCALIFTDFVFQIIWCSVLFVCCSYLSEHLFVHNLCTVKKENQIGRRFLDREMTMLWLYLSSAVYFLMNTKTELLL